MKQRNVVWSIKTLFLILSITIGLTSASLAQEKKLAMVIKVKGDVEAKYNEFIEKTIKTIGFVATDPHKRVNDAYKKKYGSTNLDLLSFMSIVNKNEVKKLLSTDPRLAGFNPFNLLIYKKSNEDTTYISHLMPEAILDIIGITDQKVKTDYIKSFEALDKLLLETFGKDVSYKTYTKLPPKTMMNFVYTFDRPEDLDDFIDEFQEQFEEKFEEKKYIIAGFFNYKEFFDGEKDLLPGFDAYWTYALCHFKYSYTVFDNEGGRPDAGIFAPCSMYMFVKKDTNELHIGMPTLANWATTLDISADKKRYEFMQQLDKDISAMLVAMGAKVVENTNPLAKATAAKVEAKKAEPKKVEATKAEPKVEKKAENNTSKSDNAPVIEIKMPKTPTPPVAPKVITIGGNPPVEENISPYEARKIKTPKSAPPISEDSGAVATIDKTSKVGEVKNSRVSAYIQGPLVDVESVKSKLTGAGFTILSEFVIDKKGQLTSIVFTNKELQSQGDKENRGFAASLRVLVDKVNNQISITNPLYLSRAFMQKDFDSKIALGVLKTLRGLFGGLKDSNDILKYHLLPKYHFMVAMPYYEDMIEIAKDDTAKLLAKAKANKNVVFTQKISENRYVIGFKLSNRTSKFVKKIGYENAGLLPYPILIEDGVAKIMAPKYYIALMYPMLKMSQFMTISTIPGAIQKEAINVLR
jgi:uncharacterized protein (DUF302 family)